MQASAPKVQGKPRLPKWEPCRQQNRTGAGLLIGCRYHTCCSFPQRRGSIMEPSMHAAEELTNDNASRARAHKDSGFAQSSCCPLILGEPEFTNNPQMTTSASSKATFLVGSWSIRETIGTPAACFPGSPMASTEPSMHADRAHLPNPPQHLLTHNRICCGLVTSHTDHSCRFP